MNRIEIFIKQLCESRFETQKDQSLRTRWIESIEADEALQLVDGLHESGVQIAEDNQNEGSDTPRLPAASYELILRAIVRAVRRTQAKFRGNPLGEQLCTSTSRLYQSLPRSFEGRSSLLEMLANIADPVSLGVFADLIVEDPPKDNRGMDQAFVPLFQRKDKMPTLVFPRLLDGLAQPGLATAILDLANYLKRNGVVATHPASEQSDRLAVLLGELVQNLGSLESPGEITPDEQEAAREQVAEGVSLGVALCDALSLIGDKKHVGKLYQASELGHRRLRVEAFAALAALGEEEGIQRLVELAGEPSMRLRAIHYAEELGIDDRVDDRYRTEESLAEAELAAWLAEPTQFGLPPTELEIYQRQNLFWPGFNQPVECFLIRFHYQFGDSSYSNVGIAGPMTHAFTADLNDLSPNDLLAAFAGWQATHQDVYEIAFDQREPGFEAEREKLEERGGTQGFSEFEWELVGVFFGERMLAGTATKDGQSGSLAISLMDEVWFPHGNVARPIDPSLVYSILKGRRFLKSFNPEGFEVG